MKTTMKITINTLFFSLIFIFSSIQSVQSQHIDPNVQASFYSKFIPLVNDGMFKKIVLVSEQKDGSITKTLEAQLVHYYFDVRIISESELGSVTEKEIVILLEDLTFQEFADINDKAAYVISTFKTHVDANRATFCLVKNDTKLALFANSKSIKSKDLNISSKLYSIMKFVE
jgi:hypothetical protein